MKAAWDTVQLGDILHERQETPSVADIANGKIRIVEKIRFENGCMSLRVGQQSKTGMILIKPGDIVVSGINASKGAIAIHDQPKWGPIAATIHYASYRPDKNKANVKFLWWMLRSQFFQELLAEHVPGGIKTELKPKRFLPIPIPLPLVNEQNRIVGKIEKLLSKITEAKSLRKDSFAATQALINAETSAIMNKFSLKGELHEVLKNKPRNGWSPRCDNIDMGTPVLTLSAVTGWNFKETAYKRTSENTNKDAHYWLQSGDILITRSNSPELVGHVAIYQGSPSPCIYPDLMMKIEVDKTRAFPPFVWRWMQTPIVRDYILRNAKGTSPTMKKISQGIVCKTPFPVGLTVDEQRGIFAELEEVQKKVDIVKKLQLETMAELEAMLPSILNRAFRERSL